MHCCLEGYHNQDMINVCYKNKFYSVNRTDFTFILPAPFNNPLDFLFSFQITPAIPINVSTNQMCIQRTQTRGSWNLWKWELTIEQSSTDFAPTSDSPIIPIIELSSPPGKAHNWIMFYGGLNREHNFPRRPGAKIKPFNCYQSQILLNPIRMQDWQLHQMHTRRTCGRACNQIVFERFKQAHFHPKKINNDSFCLVGSQMPETRRSNQSVQADIGRQLLA